MTHAEINLPNFQILKQGSSEVFASGLTHALDKLGARARDFDPETVLKSPAKSDSSIREEQCIDVPEATAVINACLRLVRHLCQKGKK